MPDTPVTMGQVVLLSTLTDIALLVIAFLLLWLALRFLDVITGFDFRRWINEGSATDAHDIALAVYLGARLVGICLLVGLGIS